MKAEEKQKAIQRMKELSGILKEASRAYYAEDREIMSNLEYDALYDELVKLENPYNCPHGRPTIVAISKYEMEKKFKRII